MIKWLGTMIEIAWWQWCVLLGFALYGATRLCLWAIKKWTWSTWVIGGLSLAFWIWYFLT